MNMEKGTISPSPERLPPLASLRCFEAAARHLNFGAAAIELCVTRSAVSHQIRQLEQHLRTALFWRRGRSVHLTPAGKLLLPIVRDSFEQIRQGLRLIRQTSGHGDLTLRVYITVAVRWLMPRLHRFTAADFSLRLLSSVMAWDFDDDQADLGMIYLRGPQNPRLHYRFLFRSLIFPVCSPALQQGGLGLRQPADLTNVKLLRVYTDEDNWRAWLDAAQLPQLAERPGPQVDTYLLAYEAAAEGQGVAITSGPFAAQDLVSGRLLRPFTLAIPEPGAWYLVYRKELLNDPRISTFEDWLLAEINADDSIQPYLC
ncbi:MAG: LysR family transcriptional regulator [Candidatus Competibacteraceae bacterium]|nr:LysR family transcriptional regulator [Candidatus Competibacteraceae bacterium]MCB1815169.1 LysR family transcriptional regulator [Candidatus Competibacteraceae bacterium]